MWCIVCPKYSPDLNPIKTALATRKALIRKAAARIYNTYGKSSDPSGSCSHRAHAKEFAKRCDVTGRYMTLFVLEKPVGVDHKSAATGEISDDLGDAIESSSVIWRPLGSEASRRLNAAWAS